MDDMLETERCPIRPLGAEHEEYLRDESRSVGEAASIAFPACEDDVRSVLARLAGEAGGPGEAAGPGAPALPGGALPAVPVTVQGGRTGLAAGAVPHGGCVLNLSKMNRALGLRREEGPDGSARYFLRVQPGMVLSQLRKGLEGRNLRTSGWDAESLAAWDELRAGPEQFFPTDPTEVSATIGGMAACNASGARSYRFGAMRAHVSALRVALADGDMLDVPRGRFTAEGRRLGLVTESGRRVPVDLPPYAMPHVKNASGYYAADGMDAADLFVGSDGTLGVITEVELALLPVAEVTWGVSCFLEDELQAPGLVDAVRAGIGSATAVEYFDGRALDVLRRARRTGGAFAALPGLEDRWRACVFVELQCADEAQALGQLDALGTALVAAGGSEADTWVARTDVDRECQRFFRHAVPESVNMLIDERRRTDPRITKLGSDMSVPDSCLRRVMALYRDTLAEEGLEYATWGHIGNNHLHVNVLPRTMDDHARGKALFKRWAAEVTRMGGAVSAEHGVGKLKRDFLQIMYGEEGVEAMARTKLQLDPGGVLGRGNLFDGDVLARAAARAGEVDAR